MNNYDFTTLNDKEFEQLVKDLLNAQYQLGLQDFKEGKDKGVDLRFSTSGNNNSLVVQVKHYVNSEFAQLKFALSNSEIHKVRKLNPDRYIVATSLSLSAIQKDTIKSIFEPYIVTSNDIFGKEDLNGIINNFEEIEKRHFKLWFSSTTILNSIINNAIEGRTRYMLEQITQKIKLYVVTEKLDQAIKILKTNKLLLITGQPGIGKTTLAEIILSDRARAGSKIYKVENINEAENVISVNPDDKQVFYFDDFLGANYFEIINANTTETQLTAFVERIRVTPNKYLILTTRTVILNQPIGRYEKINRMRLFNHQFEIKLDHYNKYEKALILYNHLYFRSIRDELFNCIVQDKFYNKIVNNRNYTPRIIDFITDNSQIEKLLPDTYRQFITNNLNNPKEIWRYSFNNQISYLDRCFLLTLFTFENRSFEYLVLEAFENRLKYEVKEHNQVVTTNQFYDSIKTLLNGFILSVLHDYKQRIREYTFINPSLTDFLIGYVKGSFPEKKSIVSSLIYVEQLERFSPDKKVFSLEKDLQSILSEKIDRGQLKSMQLDGLKFKENRKITTYLRILIKYCPSVDIDETLLKNFKKMDYSKNWNLFIEDIEYFLLNLNNAPKTFNFIQSNFIGIIEKILRDVSKADSAERIPKIFEKYGYDYLEFFELNPAAINIVTDMIQRVLLQSESDLRSEYEDEIKDEEQVHSIHDKIYTLEGELSKNLLPKIDLHYNFDVGIDWDFWNKKIEINNQGDETDDSGFDDYDEDHYRESNYIRFNEDKAIDDLFSRNT